MFFPKILKMSKANIDLSKFKMQTRKKLSKHISAAEQIPETTKEKQETQEVKQDSESPIKVEIKQEPHENPKPTSSKLKREHIKIKYETQDDNKPYKWETVLENVREMRKNCDAPVDTMGCDRCVDEKASPEVKRYQALLALMLSSQTKDEVTYNAMLRLREHGCTVDNILETTDEELGKLIYPVGFWKSKVKYIKKTTEILKKEYNGDIPSTVEDLCKLSGVGPKMANLCMKTAWGEISGIGVDTHVHRISNRLGWVNTKTPGETQKALECWLPFEFWSEVNHLLVGFGQQVCQPVRPQCATCLNHDLCPYGIDYIKRELGSKKVKKIK